MVKKILDLHIHSKYSRACSPALELEGIAKTCETRGIDIVVTGDFTHPKWFESTKDKLVEDALGLYKLKDESSSTRFLLGTEVASIKKHAGKTRRVHLLLFAPNIGVAEKFNNKLAADGFNLTADGRPILGMPCKDLLEYMLEVDERMVMIPAHAWTPWFGVLGSKGGYDSLDECFEDLSQHIFAIETGLSSDPLMNWQVPSLDNITLVSNSDAHSLPKLGREANVMQFEDGVEITYDEIMRVIREGDKEKFLYTIEFYPEEGKYHIDGHRACNFSCHPEETKKYGGICPKCKKPLVIGVMNRVVELAQRSEEEAKVFAEKHKIPYKSLVPLQEIIADTVQVGWKSKRVQGMYHDMVSKLGSEFSILTDMDLGKITDAGFENIAGAIDRVRRGNIHIVPGYDGEFGVVKVFEDGERGGSRQSSLLLE